jgi:hypothetical protein
MSASKLALVLAMTLVALFIFTKVVPRHTTAIATTTPMIFQQVLPLVY